MWIKVVIFDIDGVLIQAPHYFSKELERQWYENAVEVLNEYYWGPHVACLEGKETVDTSMPFYLEKIDYKQWVTWYFQWQFEFDSHYLDTELIETIKQFQASGILCFLWTDQEKTRAKMLLEELNFWDIFDGYFISYLHGARKSHPQFWEWVLKKLENVEPSEIVFFDDVQGNVDMAKNMGIQWFLFTNNEQFYRDLESLGINR